MEDELMAALRSSKPDELKKLEDLSNNLYQDSLNIAAKPDGSKGSEAEMMYNLGYNWDGYGWVRP